MSQTYTLVARIKGQLTRICSSTDSDALVSLKARLNNALGPDGLAGIEFLVLPAREGEFIEFVPVKERDE